MRLKYSEMLYFIIFKYASSYVHTFDSLTATVQGRQVWSCLTGQITLDLLHQKNEMSSDDK